jgi:hypothetical protein
MTDDEEQAEAAATWDQIEAILDGFPVTAPRPGAKRVADLVTEVERLRDEVGMLQQEARIRKNLCEGFAAEAEAERSAVVAWLRSQRAEFMSEQRGISAYVVQCVADEIERGEHRREEER